MSEPILPPSEPDDDLPGGTRPKPSPPDDLAAIALAGQHAVVGDSPFRRADLESRMFAMFLDVPLYIIVFGLAAGVVWSCTWWIPKRFLHDGDWVFWSFWIGWLLYTLPEVIGTGTAGKWLLGLRIANQKYYRATTPQKFARWLLRRLPDVVLACAIPLFNLHRQRYLDGLAIFVGPVLSILYLGVFVAFICCMGRGKLALYDRLTGTSVITDLDMKPTLKGAFAVIWRPKTQPQSQDSLQ